MEVIVNQEFIKDYAGRFTQVLSKPFFFNKAIITGSEIVSSYSTVKQVNKFILKNLFFAWQKEVLKLRSPYFDYENEDVKAALKVFMNKLSNHINIYQYDFEPLVKQAVADTILAAVSPVDFFKNQVEIMAAPPSPQVKLSMLQEFAKYLVYNRCVVDKVIEDMNQRGLNEMFAGEASRLFHRIISESQESLVKPELVIEELSKVEPCKVSDFVSVVKTIVSPFMAQSQIVRNPAIEEKPEVEVVVENVAEAQASEIPVVEKSLEAVEEKASEVVSELEETPIPEPIAVVEEVPSFQPQPEPMVEDKQEFKTFEPIDTETEVSATETLKVKPRSAILAEQSPKKQSLGIVREQLSLNDVLSQAEKKPSIATKISKPKIDSIQKAIPLQLRFIFQNELFNGDLNLLEKALGELDNSHDYQEAISLLKDTYATRLKWNMDDDNVTTLLELLERKYS